MDVKVNDTNVPVKDITREEKLGFHYPMFLYPVCHSVISLVKYKCDECDSQLLFEI